MVVVIAEVNFRLLYTLQDVTEGRKTVRRAAKAYNILQTTLKHYLNSTRGNKGIVSSKGNHRGGGYSLPADNERRLVECLKTMEKWGFGLSRQEVLDWLCRFIRKAII